MHSLKTTHKYDKTFSRHNNFSPTKEKKKEWKASTMGLNEMVSIDMAIKCFPCFFMVRCESEKISIKNFLYVSKHQMWYLECVMNHSLKFNVFRWIINLRKKWFFIFSFRFFRYHCYRVEVSMTNRHFIFVKLLQS